MLQNSISDIQDKIHELESELSGIDNQIEEQEQIYLTSKQKIIQDLTDTLTLETTEQQLLTHLPTIDLEDQKFTQLLQSQ
jgi:predicted RNase H-like nuclease (RuvC/YqgF family)